MYELERAGEQGFRLMGPPAFARSIVVESQRIDDCMDCALRNNLGIAIAPLEGFSAGDLSFLSGFSWVERLTILDSEMVDVSAVSLMRNLRYLQISGRTKQTITL